MLLTFRVTLVSLLPRVCPEALMLMMLLITTGQLLCESRFPAKHSTEVILVNLLKVVLLSPPDQETSLERLRNFSKALQLETTEPEDGTGPTKASALNPDIGVPVAGREGGRHVLPEGAEPSSKEPFPFPRDLVCRTKPVPGRQLHMLLCSGAKSFLFIWTLQQPWYPRLSRETPVPSGSVC